MAHPAKPLHVGILGGGQLGRMLCLSARTLGVRTTIVDKADCPAHDVADDHIIADFTDAAAIERLAAAVDVITIEIEHINTAALHALSHTRAGAQVHPAASTVQLIQDKYLQKDRMASAGIPVGEFCRVVNEADMHRVAERFGYPFMLKSRTQAYDGRGNARINAPHDIHDAFTSLSGRAIGYGDTGEVERLYAEKWVPFARELAVLVARGRDGEQVVYPTVQTIQRDSICHVVLAPAPVSGEVLARAGDVAARAVARLEGAGIFAVELFELDDGSILLNEIAPRVHNSGHFTIEACVCSQFEQHIRAVTGLPLGDPRMRVPAAAMVNVLGASRDLAGIEATWDICARALSVPGASVHWYCKKDAKPGRKMGHITITGQSPMEVATRLQLLAPTGGDASVSAQSGIHVPATSDLAPLVGIIMGSDSDLPTMTAAATTLRDFGVPFELTIVSAHRTPRRLIEYATTAHRRGLKVIIAAAGGAAHLPGMVASLTCLPVIGVPVPLRHLDGMDSLYSIVQMPRGIPVATVAIGNATNAALLAVRMLGSSMDHLAEAMAQYQQKLEDEVMHKVDALAAVGWSHYGGGSGTATK